MSVFFDGEKLCVQLTKGKNYKTVLELAKEYESEYLPAAAIYVFPPIKKIVKVLSEAGYPLDKSAEIFLSKKEDDRFKSLDGKKELYPFQKQGVKTMLRLNSNVLLADEMGLGKTPQAATYLRYKENSLPALVICPASLKENWRKEIKTWTGKDSYVIEGRKSQYLSKEFIEKYPVFIINYDILGQDNKEDKDLVQ